MIIKQKIQSNADNRDEKNVFREKKKIINENNGLVSTRWPNKTVPYLYDKNFRNQ